MQIGVGAYDLITSPTDVSEHSQKPPRIQLVYRGEIDIAKQEKRNLQLEKNYHHHVLY